MANKWIRNFSYVDDPQVGAGVAVLGNYLYLIAGADVINNVTVNYTSSFYVDPNDGLYSAGWERVANYPQTVEQPVAAAFGGKIYAFGGLSGSDTYLNNAYVYDPDADTWTAIASLPAYAGRGFVRAVTTAQFIYLFGGNIAGPTYKKTVVRYDPNTDTYTQLADMPEERANGICGRIGDFVYYAAGSFVTQKDTLFVYDIVADSWTTKATMPYELANGGGVAFEGSLYVIGGREFPANAATKKVLRYDVSTDTWNYADPLFWAIERSSVGVVNGRIIVPVMFDKTGSYSTEDVWAFGEPIESSRADFVTGFEAGGASPFGPPYGTAGWIIGDWFDDYGSVVTDFVRSGQYAWQPEQDGAFVVSAVESPNDDIARDRVLRLPLYVESAGVAGDIYAFQEFNVSVWGSQIRLRWDDGYIKVYRGATLIGTTSQQLPFGVYHLIEAILRVSSDATMGFVEVYVEGEEVLSLHRIATRAFTPSGGSFGELPRDLYCGEGTLEFRLDDIALCSYRTGRIYGDGFVVWKPLSGVDVQAEWTPFGPEVPGFESAVGSTSPDMFFAMQETSGTAADDTGSLNNDGTYAGGPTLGEAGALSGSTSVRFNQTGNDDVIDLGTNIPATLDDFTVMAWIKPADLAGAKTILSLGTGGNDFLFFLNGATISMYLEGTTKGGVGQTADGTFALFFIKRVGSTLTFYKNSGTAFDTQTYSGQITITGTDAFIGNYQSSGGWPWGGWLQGVGLWSRGISDAEIQSIVDAGSGGFMGSNSSLLLERPVDVLNGVQAPNTGGDADVYELGGISLPSNAIIRSLTARLYGSVDSLTGNPDFRMDFNDTLANSTRLDFVTYRAVVQSLSSSNQGVPWTPEQLQALRVKLAGS